ncbi:MAG TPA: toll/interleukin-1 receptor domain-containing protein [Parvularculaceae bacterium]|nr:toll/interleukin-1 receptor domain-containing protein [Parvularculaceae bacterium]
MEKFKYRAFISYSHADEKAADWLQHALESYVAPKAIVGKPTPWGPAPRRLTPIFRDRADLPAAGNLNSEIQAALSESLFQVIICSPNAAKSRWVNEEIKLFKKLHGQERTLAVIVSGEPGASAIPGREAEECFPPALRFRVDESGEITDEPAEPIAADARAKGDGRRDAKLKLIAGLLGVKLDDLIQRDAARRAREARLIIGGLAGLSMLLGGLTVAAINARGEAQTMRGQAEDLIEFMLGDLKDKLEPVGKLNVLESVGQKALGYYEQQNLKHLKEDALSRRARALILVGDIHQRRHDYDAALIAYEAAAETTEEQLRRAPNDPQWIFDHAQSVFYVAYIAAERGEAEAAEKGYQEYYRLAQQLVAIDPTNPKWRLELAYATSNLGTVRYNAGAYDEAAPYFDESVEARRALSQDAPDDADLADRFAYALSWRAFNDLLRGRYAAAIESITEQISVYDSLLAKEPDDYEILDYLSTARRRLGEAHLSLGDIEAAQRALSEAKAVADRLLAREADHALWALNAAYVEDQLSFLASLAGREDEAAAFAEHAVSLARTIFERDRTDINARIALACTLARRVDSRWDENARAQAADSLSVLLEDLLKDPKPRDFSVIGDATLALARFTRETGDEAKAQDYARTGLTLLAAREKIISVGARTVLAQLFLETGDIENARRLAGELGAIGLKHPEFVKFKERLQEAETK